MGTMQAMSFGYSDAQVSLAGNDLLKIDYTDCDIIDGDVLDDVQQQIVALINDHDCIRLLVDAGKVSQFIFDTRNMSNAPRPFTVEKSAWLVDSSNVYPITRMLDSLNIIYPVKVFVDEKAAWAWLMDFDQGPENGNDK